MSKQSNPALIGLFVVGAMVILVIAILVFSDGQLFSKKERFVVYFSGSVNGLSVGAPVKLKGVKVGMVTEVTLEYNSKEQGLMTPVYFEVELDLIASSGELSQLPDQQRINIMIQRGLRAQMAMQSIVTGQFYVELGFYPGTPTKLIRADSDVVEIPVVPSDAEEIRGTVSELIGEIRHLPLRALFESLQKTVDNLQIVTASKDFQNAPEAAVEALKSVQQTMTSANQLIEHIDKEVGPLSVSLKSTLADSRKLLLNLNREVTPLSHSANKTLASIEKTMARTEVMMQSVDGMVSDTSPLPNQLSAALVELAAAARSLRVLADYLQRNPDSIIYGKGGAGGRH